MSELYPDLNYTLFPESIDIFQQWLDITASDGPNIRRYMDAVKAGDFTQANQILAEIPSASQKIIKATDLNKLSQAMLALERFYKTDVKGYVESKQVEWQAIINQFDYKGMWSVGTSYQKSNMVSYVQYGVEYIYIAIKAVPVGTQPTNGEYWKLLTVKGQQGESGTGVAYRYQWIVSEAYTVNDIVTYDGALWIATKPSQGVTPVQGSESWKIIMTLSATAYPIQDTQPTNQAVGDLWFNTSPTPTKYYYLEALKNPAKPEDIAKGKEAYDELGRRIVGTGAPIARRG